MKCFILAGGSGDRLWPISRQNYPKQFTDLHEGRSLFQETIVRNMPLCDEFYIFINEKYANIVKGQLQYFQNLKYKLFMETEQLKTALPILIGALKCDANELILIVSTDSIVGEGNYVESVTDAKKIASEGMLALVTLQAEKVRKEYKYIRCQGEKIAEFLEYNKPVNGLESGEYFYDIGISVNRADVLLKQFKQNSPETYYKTQEILSKKKFTTNNIILDYRDFSDVPKLSLGKALNLSDKVARVVKADFKWESCSRLESLAVEGLGLDSNTIVSDCENVTVINNDKDTLVVVNEMKDAIVVNTKNAVYVSSKDNSHKIKNIIKDNRDKYGYFFNESEIFYQPWGIKEYLSNGKGYRVTKVTIFPGKFLQEHTHENKTEQWSVVSGTANIRIGNECRDYKKGESAVAPSGVVHQVGNTSEKVAVLIETALAPDLDGREYGENLYYSEPFYRLEPSFKDYIWGGSKIRDVLKKNCEYPKIAESWEISAHPAGQSTIKDGAHKDLPLSVLLARLGKECLGWKSQSFDRFPLLVKFIDAQDSLSIQVHPNDDYALMVENEYGKNEMWYIMDCSDDAYIYLGFNREVTKGEVKRRIRDNTITEVLNKVPVKKGDTFFIPATTVHAIGPGILICEIQQNSNCTYRLYDYDRTDTNGKKRELHVDKGLDVLELSETAVSHTAVGELKKGESFSSQVLCECKYFTVEKYVINGEASIYLDSSSFAGIVVLDGEGIVKTSLKSDGFKKGDSFFFPAQKLLVNIQGECEIIKIGL